VLLPSSRFQQRDEVRVQRGRWDTETCEIVDDFADVREVPVTSLPELPTPITAARGARKAPGGLAPRNVHEYVTSMTFNNGFMLLLLGTLSNGFRHNQTT
jgi:hypothetical protein